MKPQELVYFPSWTAGRKGYAERMREVFREYLKTKRLHSTPQRMSILNHLLEAERHLSTDDIYAALKHRGIGRVTVFRTVKMLEECHLVERVTVPNNRPRFEVKAERPHHDHLVCMDCGGIMEVQWPEVEQAQERTARKHGFTILYHRHELFGRCRECSNPGQSSRSN
jgi:Fur family ferric uptake transcriptional regulator